MIIEKFGTAIKAFFNSIANALWASNPVAVLQLKIDEATAEILGARKGVEQYAGLVEGIKRQVAQLTGQDAQLEAQVKANLKAGNRDRASQLVLQLQQVREQLTSKRQELTVHEEALNNNMIKLKAANEHIMELRQRGQRYAAELQMSRAEAEMARVSEALQGNLLGNYTTGIGQAEELIKGEIDKNRGRAHVAASMSSQGVEEIKADQAAKQAMADDLLKGFEVDLGLASPETTAVAEPTTKDVGPANKTTA
ncbi:MAG: PspA/IM30 family protein [bacterium]